MISQTAEYAIRAAVCLAQDSGQPMTTQQIGEQTGVPIGYLSKVLQLLGKAGLVRAQRGLHGGYVLNGTAASLTLLDTINAVDPIVQIDHCPLGCEEHQETLCSLHSTLERGMEAMVAVLREASLQDLLTDAEHPPPVMLGDHSEPALEPPPGLADAREETPSN